MTWWAGAWRVHPDFQRVCISALISKMDSKYCSSCLHKRVLSSFLKDASADLGTKIFGTCIPCRAKKPRGRL